MRRIWTFWRRPQCDWKGGSLDGYCRCVFEKNHQGVHMCVHGMAIAS